VNVSLCVFAKSVICVYLMLFSSLLLVTSAQAAIDIYTFEDDVQRLRYQSFIEELRCPKCQNQNLAGSDSPISADLRREVHRLIMEGQSDKEIIDFMVSRYGEYVLYRPRAQGATLILWFAPVLLLVLALVVVLGLFASKRRAAANQLSQQCSMSLCEAVDNGSNSGVALVEEEMAEQAAPQALSDDQRAKLNKLLNR